MTRKTSGCSVASGPISRVPIRQSKTEERQERIIHLLTEATGRGLSLYELGENFPDIQNIRLYRIMSELVSEGKVRRPIMGPRSRWYLADDPAAETMAGPNWSVLEHQVLTMLTEVSPQGLAAATMLVKIRRQPGFESITGSIFYYRLQKMSRHSPPQICCTGQTVKARWHLPSVELIQESKCIPVASWLVDVYRQIMRDPTLTGASLTQLQNHFAVSDSELTLEQLKKCCLQLVELGLVHKTGRGKTAHWLPKRSGQYRQPRLEADWDRLVTLCWELWPTADYEEFLSRVNTQAPYLGYDLSVLASAFKEQSLAHAFCKIDQQSSGTEGNLSKYLAELVGRRSGYQRRPLSSSSADPPPPVVRYCREPGCFTRLRSTNRSDRCSVHQ